MKPFNISIGFGEKEVTLTILPEKKGYYKVLYYGEIVGAIRPEADGEGWEQIPDEEISVGSLPQYHPDLNRERLDFVLCEHTIKQIGEEITASLNE
jgi:hypothetical protein